MLQLILSPVKGWEDISHEGKDQRNIATYGFFPYIGIVALTCFTDLWREADARLATVIISAIVVFIRYFIGYFVAMFIVPLKLPDLIDGEINEKRLSTFVLYSIGLLATITLIVKLLPTDAGFTHFLPIYVAIIMWKGTRYMAVKPELTGRFMVLVLLAVMLPPYLLGWLFGLLV